MSGCLLCLHLDLGLKTGFEFKVEVVFVNRDPFDQPPDHPFIVILLSGEPVSLLDFPYFAKISCFFSGCKYSAIVQ